MFGRIRASPSSLETLEGSPAKILKDDSFSIYEATLMKLKLGAKRDTSSIQMEEEEEEVIIDCSVSSSCAEEANMDADCTPASAPGSHGDGMTLMDTDCSSITTSPASISDDVSTENSEPPRQINVSILRFFKIKDPGPDTVSSSTKNGSSGSVSMSSSGSVKSNCTNEMGSAQSFRDCELSA